MQQSIRGYNSPQATTYHKPLSDSRLTAFLMSVHFTSRHKFTRFIRALTLPPLIQNHDYMAEKTEMVLVSRDELQQLIGASVRCALEEYGQTQAPQDASEYYTIRQLAEKWGVSIATIWRHEKLGHIKGQRIGRRVLFPKEPIDRIKNLKATNREADKNAKKENGKGTPTNE